MISKEEYEKLKDNFSDYGSPVEGAITYYSKEDKSICSIYNPWSDKEVLDLLEDEEFVKSLSPTELGFLVDNINVDVPDNFRSLYYTLCLMTLNAQLLPELSDKMHIFILYNFYIDNFYCGIKYDIENCYDIGYYRDDLIKDAKDIFHDALDTIKYMYQEYHSKELDISNITYEDYAVTLEYIMEKDILESEDWHDWKNAVARHLREDLAKELYHL